MIIGIYIVPVSSWTMEKEGSKHVAVTGATDKRQITAVFCGTAVGEFLPVQLIYAGKTKRCHPQFQFPGDWSITHAPKHWSNETTMLEYIEIIIYPYVRRVREDLGVGTKQAALAIFNYFKGQMTDKVFSCLEKYNIHSVLISASCTDKLQPIDISVNRAAKAFLQREFQDWYANEVMMQMRMDELTPVNLSTTEMKHHGAKRIVKMFEHISNNPHLLVNGFMLLELPIQ